MFKANAASVTTLKRIPPNIQCFIGHRPDWVNSLAPTPQTTIIRPDFIYDRVAGCPSLLTVQMCRSVTLRPMQVYPANENVQQGDLLTTSKP
ncbi:MAG: hypothetical protein COA99_05365 [Moraxellaceae bacterium]|nr:MAG: hypothetical protein COA99_05365 [Moraxellaceae bacterium]